MSKEFRQTWQELMLYAHCSMSIFFGVSLESNVLHLYIKNLTCTYIYKKNVNICYIMQKKTFSFLNPNLGLYSNIPEGWLNYLKVVVLARGCPNHWWGGRILIWRPEGLPPMPLSLLLLCLGILKEDKSSSLLKMAQKYPISPKTNILSYEDFQMQCLTVPKKLKGLPGPRVQDANSFHKSSTSPR